MVVSTEDETSVRMTLRFFERVSVWRVSATIGSNLRRTPREADPAGTGVGQPNECMELCERTIGGSKHRRVSMTPGSLQLADTDNWTRFVSRGPARQFTATAIHAMVSLSFALSKKSTREGPPGYAEGLGLPEGTAARTLQ